jgi:AbrB family looped-hinge helix DNA binding protein
VKTSHLTIKGQITLPKELREQFRLQPGDRVALEPEPDGIKVRPVRKTILDWAGTLRPPQPGLSEDEIRHRVRRMRIRRLARILSHGH